jgi:hypothetical protein
MQSDGGWPVGAWLRVAVQRKSVDAGWVRLVAVGRGAAMLLCALATSGCGTMLPSERPTTSLRGASVAFESIGGAPTDLSGKFMHSLNEEATARQITVLSSSGQATYRIRAYLAAHADPGATALSWAFDVYDSTHHRAVRLSGEDRMASPGRAGWNAVDDPMLQRVARAGMEQFASFLAAGPADAPAPPEPAAPAIAAHAPAAPQTALASATLTH